MPEVPKFFADRLIELEDAAQPWLDGVPALATRYAERWGLTFDGPAMYGYAGLVFPARTGADVAVVLKLSYPTPETIDEPIALAAWQGVGAVRLLDSAHEDSVLLLERLDSTRSLQTEPIDDAVRITAGLLRRLSIPAPPGLTRDLRHEAELSVTELPKDWEQLGRPFPRRLLDAAVEVCAELGPTADRLLVNEDLHYENVLAADREPWLVIDPKPLVGDPEFTTLALLWNRETESALDHRFAAVVDGAGLDADRARAWTLVRAVRNWLWFIEDEDTEDPGYLAVQQIAPWVAR